MQHVSFVDMNLTRDDFTWHGLHLNSLDKERIGQPITTLSAIGHPAISLNWKEVPLATPTVETKKELAGKNDIGKHRNAARSSCRPKRPPITRNEHFFSNMHIKNSVVGHSVSSDNCGICRQTCVCDQHICALNTCKVQETKLLIDKENEFTGTNQRLAVRKLNQKTQ
jgi:hypothetical protein